MPENASPANIFPPEAPTSAAGPEATAAPVTTAAHETSAEQGETSLLGLVAYASLSAFDHLAQGSSDADELTDTVLLARLAASRLDQMEAVESQLATHRVDLVRAMEPFRRAIDDFHRATVPTDWTEALLKLHLTAGLASDFAGLAAEHLTPPLRQLLSGAAGATDLDHRLAERLRERVAAAPSEQGRLSLFGRRVLGEALGQAQRVAARDSELAALVTGARPGSTDDIARVSQMMAELGTLHSHRVDDLGLFG